MREEYINQAKAIWKRYVPPSGQAEFIQGELLRAVEKLRDEAQRNANANFNEEVHGSLVAFLRTRLADTTVFDGNTINQILSDIDNLGTKDQPYLDDDIYDRLVERVVDWCAVHNEPTPYRD